MKQKLLFTLALLTLLGNTALQANYVAYDAEDQKNYIKKYRKIAIEEMERTGVPASIKLAQGLLESAAGTSRLATKGNNHFGIKCGSSWDGKSMGLYDDDRDERGRLVESCFRVYKNPEESFIAHSDFLNNPQKTRYQWLFDLETTDYKGWAYGLKKSGYATNPKYPQLLIGLIERYDLDQYDKINHIEINHEVELEETNPVAVAPEVESSFLIMNNRVKMLYAQESETIEEISKQHHVNTKRIMHFNEDRYEANEALDKGTIIYVQRKRTYFRGAQKWHKVKAGESMFFIAQLYGVQLEKLYKMNLMEAGTEPLIGEKVRLRGKTSKPQDAPKTMQVGADNHTPKSDVFVWEPEQDADVDQKDEEAEEKEMLFNHIEEVFQEDNPSTDEEDTTLELPTSDDAEDTIDLPETIELPELPPLEEEVDQPNNTETYQVHTVVKGDTLYNISKRYNITVDALKSMNQLFDNNIKIGQQLVVKK